MTLPIIAGVDPNSQFASGELSMVVRAAQDLQNKHLTVGSLGKLADDLHRAVLDIESQVSRVPVQIENDDVYGRAGALLQIIKRAISGGDVERKKVTTPVLALKESIDTLFKSVVSDQLQVAKALIEARMLAYVAAKRERERAAAAAEQKRIREEADRQAALARAMDDTAAAEAIAKAAEKLIAHAEHQQPVVESHGVKSQVVARKVVNVTDLKGALAYIAEFAYPAELEAIVTINPRALTSFVARLSGGELKLGIGFPGLQVAEVDSIRNY